MSWIAVGVGFVGSLGAAAIGASGAKDAASISNQGTQAAIAEQRVAREESRAYAQPYILTGNAADALINPLLGIAPAATGPVYAGAPQPGGADYLSYVRNNPDLMAAYNARNKGVAFSGATGDGSPADIAKFGLWHFENYGRGEGRAPPMAPAVGAPGAPGAPQADLSAGRDAAMSAYALSPWAKFADESAAAALKDANQRFISYAGASGSVNSGRTARGLYEVAQQAEDQRFREGFGQWFQNVQGVSGRGYTAATGQGDAGVQYAANVGNLATAGADARASASLAGREAISGGVNSALYYAGRAADAYSARQPNKPPPTPKSASASKAKLIYAGG